MQKAVPLMHDGGSIVLVSSGVHLKGIPFYQSYGATKAALRFWARSMAAELKDRAIRVNTLSPGATETPIFYGQFKTKEEADARKEMFKQMTPLGGSAGRRKWPRPSCCSAPMKAATRRAPILSQTAALPSSDVPASARTGRGKSPSRRSPKNKGGQPSPSDRPLP
jgi:NAD(P)-dependent dehydrogenase (short-subunit alcohol dehydrogenase family)